MYKLRKNSYIYVFYVRTMTLRGAAKTLTENAAQIQPTIRARLSPCERRLVAPMINPSDVKFIQRSSLQVNALTNELILMLK